MRMDKHEEPEGREPAAVLSPPLSPALPDAADSEDVEAQWDAYLAELARHQDGECVGGCDWTEGALSSGGCYW